MATGTGWAQLRQQIRTLESQVSDHDDYLPVACIYTDVSLDGINIPYLFTICLHSESTTEAF